MKIGLTGTICVGKTTLVKELKKLEKFKDYEIATERSKYLRDQGIELNTDSTLKGQLVFAAERSLELMKPNIITDRTLYDICAFTLSASSISWTQKRYFTELMMTFINEYDLIVYVSPEGVEIEDNGVRTIDIKYREHIDYVIKEMLVEYPHNNIIHVGGSIEKRIESILSAVY